MFAMFNQIFTAITVFCTAFEKIALTLLHLTGTAEAKAKAFADECAIENESTLAILKHRQAKEAALRFDESVDRADLRNQRPVEQLPL